MSDRPDKEAALKTLRGFQRRTVDHVVQRLLDESGSQRFLVADEVGLGKTLVARGVIAEFIDHHWDSRRIDVVYMCSNSALARENLKKLRTVDDEHSKSTTATRLTLLAQRPGEEEQLHDKLNFISLTPDTAIRTRGTGIQGERRILFHLMNQMRDDLGGGAWMSNFLKGQVQVENWRSRLKWDFEEDAAIGDSFRRALIGRKDLLKELEFLRDACARVSAIDPETHWRAGQLIGRLRNLLAQVCIDALEPDLVILDEFQRFKNLLATGEEVTEEAELADQLFNYRTPEDTKVALLLLSATPYRMFTTSDESASEDHHADFLETVRFLLDDETRYESLRSTLSDYRRELLRATSGHPNDVPNVRTRLERQLLSVMSRRERVTSTEKRDAMVTEPKVLAPVETNDVSQYLALARMRDHLKSRDLTELWKSSPYLLNFAKTYEFKRSLDAEKASTKLRNALEQSAQGQLSEEQLRTYSQLDPGNGRLRVLAHDVLENERWKMLWLPPSMPYWQLEGPWEKNPTFTKKLLFSAWNVVPDAVSALLSYEVERRMVGDAPAMRDVPYEDYYRKRAELLRFTVRNGKPAGMNTLALQVPCLSLARLHPLETPGADPRAEMRQRIEPLLRDLRPFVTSDSPDRSWYWAALLLLDSSDGIEVFLDGLAKDDDYDESVVPFFQDPEMTEAEMHARRRGKTGISVHVKRAREVLDGTMQLGALPDDLIDVLVDHALGNPAVLWARTLGGLGVEQQQQRELAASLADAFRSLFNEPPIVEMLHRGDDEAYWRTTLHYAVAGNLQAVLDEYGHQLWEPEAWGDASAEDIAKIITEKAAGAITTKTSRVRPDYYKAKPRSLVIDRKGVAVRTHFALRYGTLQGGSEAADIREDVVRDAFKSPFYPFVLASTSVGQEGLDFHPWCHAVWHWNLPGNPVDLEQREGRVHRYKGHAVRKNVAEQHGSALRSRWQMGQDPWAVMFELAESEARTSMAPELVPCWIAPGTTKVQRCVPMLPFSKELDKLENLKRSLAIYRVVFGQPRQEELMKLLHAGDISREELESWVVRLQVD